jgi:hypothetical protein
LGSRERSLRAPAFVLVLVPVPVLTIVLVLVLVLILGFSSFRVSRRLVFDCSEKKATGYRLQAASSRAMPAPEV